MAGLLDWDGLLTFALKDVTVHLLHSGRAKVMEDSAWFISDLPALKGLALQLRSVPS